MRTKTAPAPAECRGRSCQNSGPGLGLWGTGRTSRSSCTQIELGRLHSLGLLQALILSLRIADGFCQHLAQLSLGLCGFPLGWLPLCHFRYVGMPEGELNPLGTTRQPGWTASEIVPTMEQICPPGVPSGLITQGEINEEAFLRRGGSGHHRSRGPGGRTRQTDDARQADDEGRDGQAHDATTCTITIITTIITT